VYHNTTICEAAKQKISFQGLRMDDLEDRFFGKGVPQLGGPVVANPRLTDPPSFQLLFSAPLDLDPDALTLALREYHPELAKATVELLKLSPPQTSSPTTSPVVMGLVGWGRHAIKLVGFDTSLAAKTVKGCVQPSHYQPELKEAAYQHVAHVVLYYAGYEQDPLEQHVALAATAAMLTRFGAIVVVNETAHISIPAVALLPHEEDGGDTLRAMRTLPLPIIYAGFVIIEVEEQPGVWMRTYGCHAFRLPDLALQAEGHHQGASILELFSNMLDYLRTSPQSFAPGDTMGIGEGQFFRFRARTTDEWFLESVGEMLVVELINPAEVNP
jgi:hypothetical protein